nr:bifunctional metallophosphatase/5'-nucleotidase [uncultured Brevundimonas sp.]
MTTLTLLQLNDLHGYLEPHPELVRTEGGWRVERLGGVARIARLFEEARAEGPCLTLDNGDTFHGTRVAVASGGEALVPIMNALKIDAMTAHWEFAYGPAGFKALAARLEYPVLAANVFRKDDGAPVFDGRWVFERGGLRIGVIGLACPIVDKTMPPAFSEGVRFEMGVAEAREQLHQLREEKVDLVVLLSHLGFPQDLKLAAETPGVDVILSGHTHNRLHEPARVGDTLIIQSGCHGAYIGRLDLEIADGRVSLRRHRLIAVDAGPQDDQVAGLVETALAPERERLARVIGRTAIPLHRYAMASAPMDDVLLAAAAQAAGVDIAFSNGWRYGAPVAPGPVTLGDLYNMAPMNPPISRTTLTGAELKAMLEENLERTFAADPYAQMGGYIKRCRGLTAFVKLENPKGQRLDRLLVGDRPVEPEADYPVAFVTAQGVPERYGRDRRTLDIDTVGALESWFADHTPGETDLPASVLII